MCPPVHSIPKSVAEDTTITITNVQGERTTLIMPKGSSISMHIPGLHYNRTYSFHALHIKFHLSYDLLILARYWHDPYTFKPKRFLAPDWPRDAFLPFSAGPRACLGRRFSETESVVALSMFILRYRITIKEEAKYANETFEQRKARVLKGHPGVTMT